MRILHCSDSFWPRTQGIGGIQIWLTHLSREQVAEGHTVGVVTWPWPGCSDREVWNGIDVFRWPVSESELIQSPGKIRELLRASEMVKSSFRPDIVHTHLNRLASWVQTLGSRVAPTVVTVHVPAEHDGLPLKLRQRVLADADAWVVPSSDLGRSLSDRHPGSQAKLHVIPHGLDWPAAPAAPLKFDPFTFLCLGRLESEKGFDVALRALAVTARRDFRLIFAGEGNAAPELHALAAKMGIEHQVDFRGWVHPDEVPSLINQATVVLVPSLWREPFGLVALQAAQMGRPVLASKMGGLPEIVVDGVTGRLVPPGEPGALAQAMVEIANNPAQLSLWGSQALTRVRRHFTIANCSKGYQSAYREQILRTRSDP